MANLIFDNVYNFSVSLVNGFHAIITCMNGDKTPMNLSGATALMQLTRISDGMQEFTWTDAAGLITFSENKAMFGVPPVQMTPSVFILVAEQYPKQLYTYLFEIFGPDSALLVGFTGNFAIYQLEG